MHVSCPYTQFLTVQRPFPTTKIWLFLGGVPEKKEQEKSENLPQSQYAFENRHVVTDLSKLPMMDAYIFKKDADALRKDVDEIVINPQKKEQF